MCEIISEFRVYNRHTYIFQLDDNHYNATVPDICLYQFRIMAINQFGSNGYSSSVSVKGIY